MIYIPMLKTRGEELRVAAEVKDCFSDKIIPLIEVISEKYQVRFETDENGEFIREKRKTKMYRVKCKPIEDDIITLPNINKIVENKRIFIDYFRFSLKKYGKKIDFSNAELAWNLSNDYDLYKKKVLSVTKYNNMIPVISVKEEFGISNSELTNFLGKLQVNSRYVALRITEDWINRYKDIIISNLREEDYLLFDVEEQDPELKFMEIQELLDFKAKCKIILLNSPRKISVRNGEYPEHDTTDLINNCARIVADTNNLDGYGDYCGLKDAMPANDGSNGTGAALALLYDYDNNVFYSYCNHDTSLGMKGYETLIPLIKADEKFLNAVGDCPGYRKIHGMTGNGNWNTWHHINAARYIFQTFKKL